MKKDNELDAFFFNGDMLVRNSTTEVLPVKTKPRELKVAAHERLLQVMVDYKTIKPEATVAELAHAHHYEYFVPPVCKTCGALSKFNRNSWSTYCDAKCQIKDQHDNKMFDYSGRSRTDLDAKYGMPAEERKLVFNQLHDLIRHGDFAKFPEAKLEGNYDCLNDTQKQTLEKAYSVKIKRQNSVRLVKKRLHQEKINGRVKELEANGFKVDEISERGKILKITHSCSTEIFNPRVLTQCYICHAPNKERSQWNFMQSLPGGFMSNHRLGNRMQLDAYWPEHKLAIEYNGLYWHSTAVIKHGRSPRPPSYHQDKMLAAKAEGIRLITLWEDELHEEHVKSLFGSRKYYARKCEIREVDSKTSTEFLNNYHRDKSVRGASCHLGLYCSGELVMVATFGKNRFKEDGHELYRLAAAHGVTVVGGVSKLISYFRKCNTGKLTTYSSAEWGWGGAYEKAGGKLVGLTKPNYFYYCRKTSRRVHRLGLSKKNFQKTAGVEWDDSLNEEENALKAQYYRVYGCGNWKFVWV